MNGLMPGRWGAWFPGALLLFTLCGGCGDASAPVVRGDVSINGTPVREGVIQLLPLDGAGRVVGAKITAGAYSVAAPPGKKRVEIQAYEQDGLRPMDPTIPGSAMVPIMKPLLPEKYNTASELTLDVAGDTDKDFELTVP